MQHEEERNMNILESFQLKQIEIVQSLRRLDSNVVIFFLSFFSFFIIIFFFHNFSIFLINETSPFAPQTTKCV